MSAEQETVYNKYKEAVVGQIARHLFLQQDPKEAESLFSQYETELYQEGNSSIPVGKAWVDPDKKVFFGFWFDGQDPGKIGKYKNTKVYVLLDGGDGRPEKWFFPLLDGSNPLPVPVTYP